MAGSASRCGANRDRLLISAEIAEFSDRSSMRLTCLARPSLLASSRLIAGFRYPKSQETEGMGRLPRWMQPASQSTWPHRALCLRGLA